MRVLYSGLLRSPASWARVGRELLRSLVRLGVEVAALRVRGFLYAPDFALPEGVREVTRDEFAADVELTFSHPGLYGRLQAARRAGLLVYEADRMPAAWAEPIRRELDLLLLPSEFCRQGSIRAGVPSHLISRLPFGVDLRIFTPPADRSARPFTFLFVGAPHQRKGLRELLAAYRSAFTAGNDVRLVVKTTYDPAARRRRFRWELNGIQAELAEASLDQPGAPAVEVVSETLSDRGLSQLYRQAHVFVQPSYGEGFGLALLEAAASGCAAIITGWGASAELFNRDAACHVEYDLVSARPYEYDRDSQGLMARPRVLDLAAAMRTLWEEPVVVERLQRAALRVAARYTWDEAGRLLRGHLSDIVARPKRH